MINFDMVKGRSVSFCVVGPQEHQERARADDFDPGISEAVMGDDFLSINVLTKI